MKRTRLGRAALDRNTGQWPRPVTAHTATRRAPSVVRVRTTAEVPEFLSRVVSAMTALAYPARDVFAVRLALEEALVNAIKHGNRSDPSKEVRVRYRVTAEEVVAEVADQGPGFDPTAVPDPTAPTNLEHSGGRGLLLMRYYLTDVRYDRRGNRVTLWKRRSGS